ncbi:potassium transporter [Ectothiorhodospiraceae bacterium WFHF3C12]|nr:potassium transporter [Ectothiorhodospiraceae bacterium WFHF3C12]
MHFDAVQRIFGVLLMLFSVTMLPPALISLIAADGALIPFLIGFGVILGIGLVLWLPVHNTKRELRTRDGFFIVSMFWVVLSLAGALPLALSEDPHLPIVDAVFESVSGLTTTGATVIVGIDELPLSIRYYRQQLQWLGGMGIIVLAVAILPMLGIGGMQLYRAEMPGPVKDKLTPRIAETAKALWYIYLGLTVLCAIAYWIAGMSAFDAIAHSFSTVSTAGFSTYDASIGHFDSPLIEMIAAAFMLAGGVNFSLHFMAFRRGTIRPYLEDPEWRFYVGVVATVVGATALALVIQGSGYASQLGVAEALRHGVFQVISFMTTSGFTTAQYTEWPTFVPVLLIFLSFLGGCASSTSGGIKNIRFLLLFKQGSREIMRLIHPQATIPIKVGERPVHERVIDSVWGFFATYMAVFAVIMLSLMAMGLDQVTAFSAVAATLNNLGPGLGEVASNFATVPDTPKWLLSLAMIMGRLEIFTLLVLMTPAFWRR